VARVGGEWVGAQALSKIAPAAARRHSVRAVLAPWPPTSVLQEQLQAQAVSCALLG